MDNDTNNDAAGKGLDKVIRIDTAGVKDHLGQMVRRSVEETLNSMLDAEADSICKAGRHRDHE